MEHLLPLRLALISVPEKQLEVWPLCSRHSKKLPNREVGKSAIIWHTYMYHKYIHMLRRVKDISFGVWQMAMYTGSPKLLSNTK